MNPDYTILCTKCHQPVVRVETHQRQILFLTPQHPVYVFSKRGTRLLAQRIYQAGIPHECPVDSPPAVS